MILNNNYNCNLKWIRIKLVPKVCKGKEVSCYTPSIEPHIIVCVCVYMYVFLSCTYSEQILLLIHEIC